MFLVNNVGRMAVFTQKICWFVLLFNYCCLNHIWAIHSSVQFVYIYFELFTQSKEVKCVCMCLCGCAYVLASRAFATSLWKWVAAKNISFPNGCSLNCLLTVYNYLLTETKWIIELHTTPLKESCKAGDGWTLDYVWRVNTFLTILP